MKFYNCHSNDEHAVMLGFCLQPERYTSCERNLCQIARKNDFSTEYNLNHKTEQKQFKEGTFTHRFQKAFKPRNLTT